MLSEQLQNRFGHIVSEAVMMVAANTRIEDLADDIDFASIYAKSRRDYFNILGELDANGEISHDRPSGNYYLLAEPLNLNAVTIQHVRVRKFDEQHHEEGYADFKVRNYEDFKRRYIDRPRFSLLTNPE